MRLAPTYLFYNYTTQCSSRCTTCRLWASTQHTIPLWMADRLGDFIDPRNLKEVYFTGGEPLLPVTCIDHAIALTRLRPGVAISGATNSLLPDLYLGRVRAMQQAGVWVNMIVSLNGTKETHDRTRGVPGAYDRALEMIDGLKRIGSLLAVNILEIPDETTEADRQHALKIAQSYGVKLWHSPILRHMPWFGVPDDGATVPRFECRGGGEVCVVLPNGDITACQEPRPELVFGNLADLDRVGLDPYRVQKVQQTVREYRCQPCGCCTPAFSEGLRCAT